MKSKAWETLHNFQSLQILKRVRTDQLVSADRRAHRWDHGLQDSTNQLNPSTAHINSCDSNHVIESDSLTLYQWLCRWQYVICRVFYTHCAGTVAVHKGLKCKQTQTTNGLLLLLFAQLSARRNFHLLTLSPVSIYSFAMAVGNMFLWVGR